MQSLKLDNYFFNLFQGINMFCSKCGAQNEETATSCSNCGEVFAVKKTGSGFEADKAKEQVKVAMNDAVSTLKSLGIDPVGGLLQSYNALGEARALGVGIAFGFIFAFCFVITVGQIPMMGFYFRESGSGQFFKLLIVGFIPFLSLSAASLIANKITHAKLGFSSNFFIAGVALLPLGLVSLVTSLIGFNNYEIVFVLSTISICITIMVLFAGLTRIGEISDKSASYTVPLMLITSTVIGKVILDILF